MHTTKSKSKITLNHSVWSIGYRLILFKALEKKKMDQIRFVEEPQGDRDAFFGTPK